MRFKAPMNLAPVPLELFVLQLILPALDLVFVFPLLRDATVLRTSARITRTSGAVVFPNVPMLFMDLLVFRLPLPDLLSLLTAQPFLAPLPIVVLPALLVHILALMVLAFQRLTLNATM
jgi:hypothetical protein